MRMYAFWLLVLAVLVASPLAATERDTTDWGRVKAEWAELSSLERARYQEQVLRRAARAGSSRAGIADDDCDGTTLNLGALPFVDSDDTSAFTDQLDLGASGPCNGGGNQFTGTGTGPEAVYRVRVDAACQLDVTLVPTAPTPGNDLALYILNGCSDPAALCLAVQDTGGPGESETILLDADTAFVYFVVVDGWAGDAGPYTLTISEVGGAGCTLVPVEIQRFDVE